MPLTTTDWERLYRKVADRHANLTSPGEGYERATLPNGDPDPAVYRCQCRDCQRAAGGGYLPKLVVTHAAKGG